MSARLNHALMLEPTGLANLLEHPGFWIVAISLLIWLVVAMLAKTAESHRRHAAETDRKRCAQCRWEHPGFAAYCRRCGSRLSARANELRVFPKPWRWPRRIV